MPLFNNISLSPGASLENALKKLDPQFKSFRILKKSLDARKKSKIMYIYTVETFASVSPPPLEKILLDKFPSDKKPMTTIIGAGPAGLFAALRLVERGLPCRILERGKPILERMRDISRHWKKGQLNPDSNVCFGEGGAGTFSDGKLITRIKSEHIDYVMQRFVDFGSPEEILYLANPHVGSNQIRKVISRLSDLLQEKGCSIEYETRAEEFHMHGNQLTAVTSHKGEKFESDHWILASGHSAHDVYHRLIAANILCESKSFAMGFRIEHPQEFITKAQYGKLYNHPDIPTANYKISCHDKKSDLGVYSFCMCPGGYVLASSAQAGHMVVNGMSNYNHGSPFANSGLVITIDKDKWLGNDPLKALEFQSKIEQKAFATGQDVGATIQVPAQTPENFMRGIRGDIGRSSCPSGVISANLQDIYPKELTEAYVKALENFERKIPGFLTNNALLHAVESRTSSPIRVPRDKENLESPSCMNLYPCGEGAGYAGGITSAAVDGIRCAEAIFAKEFAKL
ncbi:hypothetical protein PQO03_03260 [Lentisphaera profundi]|uniref:FAD-dependent protein C-terminal domain-containing protein n=1 Tax=Lentisphaera profundi TaxID=1658616 RepID=A0ABY7VRZ4_9BACT|nr:hypothetical protein [Lentisphaera profundi]WDE96978.1 hypothetical protein PQO03_03260 [Lentisphaera profundi]